MNETDKIAFLVSRVRKKSDVLLIQELGKHGLGGLAPSHGEVLLALLRSGELSMKQITDSVNRKKSTVTVLVDKLIMLGYAKKAKCLEDNRVYYISLTKEGRKLKKPLAEISKQLNEKIAEHITKKELECLAKTLHKIHTNW